MSDSRLAAPASPRHSPPLAELPDVLAWRPTTSHPRVWRDAFDIRLRWLADQVCGQDDSDGALAASLSLLSEDQLRRFLRAPVVAMLLCSPIATSRGELIAEYLQAELAALGLMSTLPRSTWTPRGDRFLDVSDRSTWTEPERTLAETRIAIDVQSSFEFPDDDFGLSNTKPHEDHEKTVVLQRLGRSAAALAERCPPAWELVTTMIEVLALRRHGETTGFGSSTFSECPGLVRFTNAHLPSVESPDLMESLVHEAIHCVLHIHEELTEPFVTNDAADPTVTSPWTGATIRLQSYVHACAVWYGIYWLWSSQPPAAESAALVYRLRQTALAGFLRRPASKGLRPLSHLLSDSAREFLDELEQRMLGFAGTPMVPDSG